MQPLPSLPRSLSFSPDQNPRRHLLSSVAGDLASQTPPNSGHSFPVTSSTRGCPSPADPAGEPAGNPQPPKLHFSPPPLAIPPVDPASKTLVLTPYPATVLPRPPPPVDRRKPEKTATFHLLSSAAATHADKPHETRSQYISHHLLYPQPSFPNHLHRPTIRNLRNRHVSPSLLHRRHSHQRSSER